MPSHISTLLIALGVMVFFIVVLKFINTRISKKTNNVSPPKKETDASGI